MLHDAGAACANQPVAIERFGNTFAANCKWAPTTIPRINCI